DEDGNTISKPAETDQPAYSTTTETVHIATVVEDEDGNTISKPAETDQPAYSTTTETVHIATVVEDEDGNTISKPAETDKPAYSTTTETVHIATVVEDEEGNTISKPAETDQPAYSTTTETVHIATVVEDEDGNTISKPAETDQPAYSTTTETVHIATVIEDEDGNTISKPAETDKPAYSTTTETVHIATVVEDEEGNTISKPAETDKPAYSTTTEITHYSSPSINYNTKSYILLIDEDCNVFTLTTDAQDAETLATLELPEETTTITSAENPTSTISPAINYNTKSYILYIDEDGNIFTLTSDVEDADTLATLELSDESTSTTSASIQSPSPSLPSSQSPSSSPGVGYNTKSYVLLIDDDGNIITLTTDIEDVQPSAAPEPTKELTVITKEVSTVKSSGMDYNTKSYVLLIDDDGNIVTLTTDIEESEPTTTSVPTNKISKSTKETSLLPSSASPGMGYNTKSYVLLIDDDGNIITLTTDIEDVQPSTAPEPTKELTVITKEVSTVKSSGMDYNTKSYVLLIDDDGNIITLTTDIEESEPTTTTNTSTHNQPSTGTNLLKQNTPILIQSPSSSPGMDYDTRSYVLLIDDDGNIVTLTSDVNDNGATTASEQFKKTTSTTQPPPPSSTPGMIYDTESYVLLIDDDGNIVTLTTDLEHPDNT
ncbi:hypothetical protein H4219_006411, partial [Mycoemilia scoparia]